MTDYSEPYWCDEHDPPVKCYEWCPACAEWGEYEVKPRISKIPKTHYPYKQHCYICVVPDNQKPSKDSTDRDFYTFNAVGFGDSVAEAYKDWEYQKDWGTQ